MQNRGRVEPLGPTRPTESGWHDNIFTERLGRSVKYEEVYLHEYRSPREARRGLREYFEFYNNHRPHQALGYRTPAEVYREGKNREMMIAGS